MLRAITISLLFLFLADAIGTMLFLFVDWYDIREEMEQLMNSKESENKAITLQMDQKEFDQLTWVNHDHEFIYRDKLFDVFSLVNRGGTIVIRCVEDIREADFFNNIRIAMHHDDAKGNRLIIVSFFKFLSSLALQFFSCTSYHSAISQSSFPAYNNLYQFSFQFPRLQPPDGISFFI